MNRLCLWLLLGAALFGHSEVGTPRSSVWFEPNRGQVLGRTQFVGRTQGAFLYLTGAETVFALPPDRYGHKAKMRQVKMAFVGASMLAMGVGEEATGGYSNYFVGKSEKDWHSGVSHFQRVRFAEVYPGIDVVYYGVEGRTEYDFEVKPGADLSRIAMRFTGADSVALDGEGNLAVRVQGATIRQHKPRVFQGAVELESWYEVADGVVRIRVDGADSGEELTIDPILDFSTYLGGPGTDGFRRTMIANDGNLLLLGVTQSPATPALDPFLQPSVVGLAPIVLKMSPDGKRILFFTTLGRNGWDNAAALALAKDGEIVLGGSTRSTDFPLKNAFQTQFKAIFDNAFVARLSADGRTLIYSSYMGGSNSDYALAVDLDPSGNAYYAGTTFSNDFPTVAPLQPRLGGLINGFVTRITPAGKPVFSTYFGGSGTTSFQDVKWRSDGVLILAGSNGDGDLPLKEPIQSIGSPRPGWPASFLALLSDDGASLLYSTYFGGTATGGNPSLALDRAGRIHIAGEAWHSGFPLKNPLFTEAEGFHSFLAVFDRTGRVREYSTIIPGVAIRSLALDEDGSMVLAGKALSPEAPVRNSHQPFRGGGVSNTDAFVMKVTPDGQGLHFATIMGGERGDVSAGLALGPNKVIYASGQTESSTFPSKNAYQPQSGGGDDGFLIRLTDDSTIPTVASFAVSPGRLTFRFTQGEPAPPSVPLAISGLNGQVFAEPTVPWLRVTPTGLGVNGTMTVTANPASLAPGIHQGAIKLTPSTGNPASVDVILTVLAAAPILAAAEPALVPIGSDDTTITIRGSGFTNQTSVQINTVPWGLTPITFVDSTTLRFVLPKLYFSVEVSHSITVSNPNSAVSAAFSVAAGRPAPAIAAGGIVSAASFAGGAISPGEILTIFGEHFEQGMRVLFDGTPATPLYITPTQLSVSAPFDLAGARATTVMIEQSVERRSVPVQVSVAPARPGLFTADSSGKGLAAALNQDGLVNSVANAAAKGSVVVLYATGGGRVGADGLLTLPVKVFVDGIECQVLYAGQAPGLVAGALQINAVVPEAAVTGEVVLQVDGIDSQAGVKVAIQ